MRGTNRPILNDNMGDGFAGFLLLGASTFWRSPRVRPSSIPCSPRFAQPVASGHQLNTYLTTTTYFGLNHLTLIT
jgi:hypothetical protein